MACGNLSLNPGDGLFKVVMAFTLITTVFLAIAAGALCQVVPHMGEPFNAIYPAPDDLVLPASLTLISIVFLSTILLNGALLLVSNRRLALAISLLVFILTSWYLGYIILAYWRPFISMAAPDMWVM